MKVGRFSPQELERLFDAPRLARHFPDIHLDSSKLSAFHWLVVEEEVEVGTPPASRALPFLEMDFKADLGAIEPYGGRFPETVEAALFFLLLAPWEQWAEMAQVDWRGFRLPWIYTVSSDLCIAPDRPPDSSKLSWEPKHYNNEWGETIEIEEPSGLTLNSSANTGIRELTDAAWNALQTARNSTFFTPPVEHFLVRAFLVKGIDEVLAHLTVIEAAFGLESDHKPKLRSPGDKHNFGATKRVASRLSAALNDAKAAKDYLDLFDVRSMYVHGRPGIQAIPTEHRVLARSLARRAAAALVDLSHQEDSREVVMARLLNVGAGNLP
ncbi:hypothetical protein [Aquipseudomonas alcaligenes]|uniref:hypothetical protein n=1 Tax=Aquipseudomonas alcaligenes TaxID=43263 RepID=UPI00374A0D80